MILSDIRDYVRDRGQSSLSDVALHFDSSADAVRNMLDVWVKKGLMSKVMGNSQCGGCTQCDPAANEIYVWGASPTVILGCRKE